MSAAVECALRAKPPPHYPLARRDPPPLVRAERRHHAAPVRRAAETGRTAPQDPVVPRSTTTAVVPRVPLNALVPNPSTKGTMSTLQYPTVPLFHRSADADGRRRIALRTRQRGALRRRATCSECTACHEHCAGARRAVSAQHTTPPRIAGNSTHCSVQHGTGASGLRHEPRNMQPATTRQCNNEHAQHDYGDAQNTLCSAATRNNAALHCCALQRCNAQQYAMQQCNAQQ